MENGTQAEGGRESARAGRSQRIVDRAVGFYRTYTSGFRSGDFKRLFTEETRGIWQHFRQEQEAALGAEKDGVRQVGFKDALSITGRVFWGFLLAMSPARRLLYGIAFLIFLAGSIVLLTAPYGSDIRQDVATLSMYSFIIATFLLALELADKLSARDEIEIAREIQLSLLPPEELKLPGFEVIGFSAPAADVGGDYYDFTAIDGRIYMAIGDVSGHGLASGLLMAMAKSAWQTQLYNDPTPERVLASLNRIVRNAGDSRTLMTFLHCSFDTASRSITYANAGHIYPLLCRVSTGEVRWLESRTSYPLGVREEQEYHSVHVELAPQDLLLFMSDGVVEATNDAGESYGYERVLACVRRHAKDGQKALMQGLLDDIQQFAARGPREDDMTMIIARIDAGSEGRGDGRTE